MKKKLLKIRLMFFAAIMFSCTLSCKKKTFESDVFVKKTWKVELTSVNEIPAVPGRTDHAVGLVYLMDNNQLTYDIYFDQPLQNGDVPTTAKLYLGSAAENGTLLIDLNNGTFNDQREVKGSLAVSDETAAALLSATMYLQVASKQAVNGLVRGQTDQPVKLAMDIDLSKFSGSVNTTATGKLYLRLLNNNNLVYQIVTSNVPANDLPTSAHIHKTIDNSIQITLAASAADFNKAITLPATSVPIVSLTSDQLYVDIHSQLYPLGLLKGTIR